MPTYGGELMRTVLAATAVAQRQGEIANYMEPVVIESTGREKNGHGNHVGERVCMLHKRVPFVYENGGPYACLRMVIPVILRGDVDALRNDHRVFGATYELNDIPMNGGPPKVTVAVAASHFADADVVELPASLPVIMR